MASNIRRVGTSHSMNSSNAMAEDWQIAKLTNAERARHMLDTSLYADCEFLVGGNDELKEVIKAHRVFLAMGSPVFEAMFFGGMAQAAGSSHDQPIAVPDLQPSAFKDLLLYIYTEKHNITTFDQACELCYAAKKYMVPRLVEDCSQFMWKDLVPENVCRALEFANLYEDPTLKAQCLDLIRKKTRQSVAAAEFEEMAESTLLILVKEEVLSIGEAELFDAVKRWAVRQCAQREVEPTGPNMRQALSSIISHIRFLTMSSEEFATSPAVSGILTEAECLAILMNLSSRDKWPMPATLSVCRQQRQPRQNVVVSAAGPSSPIIGLDPMIGQRCPSRSSPVSPSLFSAHPSTGVSGGASALSSMGPTGPRIYCYRRVEGETLVDNTGILDCAVTLTVDRNVCIQGIVISSQAQGRAGDPVGSEAGPNGGYTELLYCHLLDRDGTRLTYSHFSGRSPRRSTLDVFFNRPVYVQRNREYRICVVLNRQGLYPLGTASTWVISQGVHFRFGSSSREPYAPNEGGIRDGFIRGVIFSF